MTVRARDWAELCAPISAPAWAAVADATGIGEGTRVLDAGCGTGEFCRLAAGRGAVVSGIDRSQDMLALARAAAPAADLRFGGIELLPWPQEWFGVVTSFNALQFTDDHAAALAELRRVTRPGGLVAVCNWRGPAHSELLVVTRALREVGSAAASGSAPALGEPGVLEELARAAGLRPVAADEVAIPVEARDLDTLDRLVVASGVATAAIERSGRQAVRAAIEEAAGPFRLADGSYRFENAFRYVVARR